MRVKLREVGDSGAGGGALALAAVLLVMGGAPPATKADGADAAALEFFERRVRPVLAANCYECHGPEKRESGLRLDHIDTIVAGGDRGPALLPGSPDDSRLIEAVRYANVDLQMPPRSRLDEREVEYLWRWVEMGAPWPEEPRPAGDEVGYGERFDLDRRKAEHWAWQPVRPVEPPAVEDEAGVVAHPIDRFIIARLEAEGLSAAPPADRRTLIRRVYFDLVGLPPSPEEVEAFLHDDSPDAYEKVVDRLLASPHFGERWARHWMDLVRYSETHGHQFDYPINHAWPYRDYLIRALNDDVSYDRLVTEHIAGDLLDEPRIHPSEGFNESVIGTAFFWFGEAVHGPVDVRADQADRIDNQIDVMSKAFMGLTVSCARCHDHMFDAISTKDFYSLYGIMAGSRRDEAHLDRHGRIGDARARIQSLRDEADAALARTMPTAEAAERHVEQYLTAAIAVVGGEADAAEVAEWHELDIGMLRRWADVLGEEAADAQTHPLHPLRRAVTEPEPESAWAEARERLDRRATAVERLLRGGELYADFTDGYGGWRGSGQAFDGAPTRPGRFDALRDGPMRPDLAYSAATAPGLRGTLRSPTFTIDSDYILYRAAGRHGQVRLIVDNYHIDVFNPNLFHGMHFTINSGRFRWHTQDVSRYRGHRAYIELIDDGDAFWSDGLGEREQLRNRPRPIEGDTWVALDKVVFADERAPEGGNPLAARLRDEATVTSAGELARVYARLMGEAVELWRSRGATGADSDVHALLGWAWRRDLLPLGEGRAELEAVAQRIRRAWADVPEPMRALATADGNGIDERVFIRGSHLNLGDKAPRRFLEAIAGPDQPPISAATSGRLELSRRMTDPRNPFHSRVIVNRLWHHLFGRGIVATVDDFGVMGEEPTHPELLDYLADRFLRDGESLKAMIRLMVTSDTYRLSSRRGGAGDRLDPTNRLLHRMPIRRLQGEAIRDAMLAISGRLDGRMHGPGVEVHLTEFLSGRGRPAESGPLDGDGRRSVYTRIRRNFLPSMMHAFDMPLPVQTVGRRDVSNVPAQALILLNDPFVIEQAELWARRLIDEHGELSTPDRIARMYQEAYARLPERHEVDRAIAFLDEQAAALGTDAGDVEVWADLAHVMLNVKDFIFVE